MVRDGRCQTFCPESLPAPAAHARAGPCPRCLQVPYALPGDVLVARIEKAQCAPILQGTTPSRFPLPGPPLPATQPGSAPLAPETALKSPRRGRHFEAVRTSLVAPAPGRVQAPCALFGACGGCALQELDYSAHIPAVALEAWRALPAPAPVLQRSVMGVLRA